MGALFPWQLVCVELVNPTYWRSRERQEIINRALVRAGYIPTEVDFRQMTHRLMDYVEGMRMPFESALETLNIPVEPMLLVVGVESDFLVVGHASRGPNE